MSHTSCIKLFVIALLILPFYSTHGQTNSDKKQTLNLDTIPSGLQGSINPLSDNFYVLTGEELLDNSFPNSIPLLSSKVRMRIGGYVKADLIRDLDYIGDRYEFELGSIAVERSPERELGGITTFHAKQTRLNFDFRSKAKWEDGREFPLQVFLEVDWFFDSDNFRLNTRLRHAYGVIGRLLVGRTWTTSVDLATVPSTIDFSGGDALYGARTTQIRWQDKINDRLTYAVALEDFMPQIDNVFNQDGANRPLWPNIAGMVKGKSLNGSTIQLGVDLFPVSWKGPSTVPNENKFGYGLSLTSRILIRSKPYTDAISWGGGYGKGQGNKIVALSWDGKASGALGNNTLNVNPSWWAFFGVNHYWTNKLNSNFSTAWAGTELANFQSNQTIKSAGSFHVNLIYFPYELVSLGAEYMWGIRENKDGTNGNASRLQFMFKFKFN